MVRCHTYPKAARLRRRADFLDVQRSGRRMHTPHFVVIRRAGRAADTRLGVTVSSRVGNAVARNRLKRLVREVFRQRRSSVVAPTDLVVIAKPGANHLSNVQAAIEIERAFQLAAAG